MRRLIGAVLITGTLLVTSTACSATDQIESKPAPTSAVRSKYPEPVDLANARAECLEAKGWVVKVADDASINAELTVGTEADYRSDDFNCLKHLGIDPDAPPTDAQYRSAYEASIAGAECLRNEGYQISAAPSFARFKDTYDTDAWYPWAEVADDEFDSATQSCPTPEPTY